VRPLRALAVLLLIGAGTSRAAPAPTSCTACHFDPEWFPDAAAGLQQSLADDVHARADLSCHDCHGGNPDPALAGDLEAAMDPGYAPNPFRGAPERKDVPGFCGHCHSDPEFMKRFDPAARVDQEREYWTSRHGAALAQGNERVATCVSCHGAHGIHSVSDSNSPVHPIHVAETCAECHADPDHMRGAERDDGSPLPIDQYARWSRSVHANALLERGDLSAPTCNDCHGNHGAVPPGVDSVAMVCGNCHGREAALFRDSAKRADFHAHNELLAEAGGECRTCHEQPEPQAALTGLRHFAECATCHGNHSVMRPTLASLSPLPPYPCAFCHEDVAGSEGASYEPEDLRARYARTRDALLAEAGDRMGDELFDWMVDRMLALPAHHVAESDGDKRKSALSPAFSRLFERFRIGKTHFVYDDPETGEERREAVIRCGSCHAPEPVLGDGRGFETSADAMRRMREITSLTARAERILLRARSGGVLVQSSLLSLDRAVDAQIQLEALLHGFDTGTGSAFAEIQHEGLEHARSAITGGLDAMRELSARRRGLAVALVLIALVLFGLGLKIRRLGEEKGPSG
jgi:hypothetical protein